MMAITTNSSIRVNPYRPGSLSLHECLSREMKRCEKWTNRVPEEANAGCGSACNKEPPDDIGKNFQAY